MKKLISYGIIVCYLIIIIIIVLSITSCKDSSYHLQKFYSKGGKIEHKETIIKIKDTIKLKDGKDSIIIKEVQIECPQPIIETKWKTKYLYKQRRDSIIYKYKEYKDSIKNNETNNKIKLKQKRIEKRNTKWRLFIFIVVIIGLIIAMLLKKIKVF